MRKKAMLWERVEGDKARCDLCCHGCVVKNGSFGLCGVRQCVDGELFTYVYGNPIAQNIDPVEKKPLYHFFPGSLTYSVATIGCNFRCGFCQNWRISTRGAKDDLPAGPEITPSSIVEGASGCGATSISYTYTEPTIFFEYAYDISNLAKQQGLKNIFVTNGYMTPRALKNLTPVLDAANIDLKFFNDADYLKFCGGKLDPVLDCIVNMKEQGIWLEITTLVIPGYNDSEMQLKGIAEFLAGIDNDMPWHLSIFHPDHKLRDKPSTTISKMDEAMSIGREAGLKYVYIGNSSRPADTLCPECGKVVISRHGYHVKIHFKGNSYRCSCGCDIYGVWS